MSTKLKFMSHADLILILLAFIIFIFLSFANNSFYATNSPDAVQQLLFSENLASNKGLLYCENDLSAYSEINLFGSRGLFFSSFENCFTHSSMHGFIIIMSFFYSISESLIYLINPLFFLLSAIILRSISQILGFNSQKKILLAFLLVFSAPVIFYSTIHFNNLAEVTFMLGATLYFLRAKEEKNYFLLILFYLFFSVGFWIRYPSVIYFIPFFITAMFSKDKLFRNNFIRYVPIAIFMGLILLFLNHHLYGTILGSVSVSSAEDSNSLANADYYFSDRPEALLPVFPFYGFNILIKNIKNHIFLINPVLSIFLLSSSLLWLFDRESKHVDKRIILGLISLNVLFYIGGIWTGFDHNFVSIGTSYSRYLLFSSYLFILVISSNMLFLLGKERKKILVLFLIIVTYMILSFNVGLFAKYALLDLQRINTRFVETQDSFLSTIPENAIVFTVLNDKFIFPQRKTAIYSTFPEETRINDTGDLIKSLLESEHLVYFIDDGAPNNYDIFEAQLYFDNLDTKGVNVIHIRDNVYAFNLENEK